MSDDVKIKHKKKTLITSNQTTQTYRRGHGTSSEGVRRLHCTRENCKDENKLAPVSVR